MQATEIIHASYPPAPPATGARGGGTNARAALLPTALLMSGVGILLVACGYAASRAGGSLSTPLFWAGQGLLLAAAGAVLLAPLQSPRALAMITLTYSTSQWLIRVAYAPLQLEFADELQHHRSAASILEAGHLFPTNFSLPISGAYPGLESVAVGLQGITGMDLHAAELATAGLGHILGTTALLVLLTKLTSDMRAAALATLIYSVGSSATFNTMFAYQTLALPLAILAITAFLSVRTTPHPRRMATASLATAGSVVVTHHLTSFALAATLTGILVYVIAKDDGRRQRTFMALVVAGYLGLLAAWTLTVARGVLPYLGVPIEELLSDLNGTSSSQDFRPPPGVGQPVIERTFTYAATLIPVALLGLSALVAWRRERRGLALATAGALGLQMTVAGLRLLASDGAELAGRAVAFTALVVAAAGAAVIAAVRSGLMNPPRRHRAPMDTRFLTRTRIAGALGFSVIAVGGITAGWPPRYERLPTYQVAGFESAMDRHTVAAANWAAETLTPGNRVGADFGNLTAQGTIGNQKPVIGDYPTVFTEPLTPGARDAARRNALEYLVVDRRVTLQLPPPDRGSWYDTDPKAGTYKVPVAEQSLDDLDSAVGRVRIFDDGAIRIYDLRGSEYLTGSQ